MKRRSVLQALVAGSSALALTTSLNDGSASRSASERVFILVDLKGGNDGLNTLAPIEDARYRRAHPTLALDIDALVGARASSALSAAAPLWHQNRLGLLLVLVGPSRVGVISRHPINGQRGVKMVKVLLVGSGLLDRGITAPLLSFASAGSAAMEGGSALALQLDPSVLRSGLSEVFILSRSWIVRFCDACWN